MQKEYQDLLDQLIDFFLKWVTIFLWIFLSFIGKLSAMILQGKEITWLTFFAEAGVTLFFGAFAVAFCKFMKFPDVAQMLIVPSVCFLSDKIALAVMKEVDFSFKKLLIDILDRIKDQLTGKK